MKCFEGMELKELKKIKKVVSQYGSMEELKNDLDIVITTREEAQKTSMNILFNMEWWIKYHVFYPWEIEILKKNHIMNLQELIDCDLNQLEGITESAKEVFDWARHFYDFSPMEEKKKKHSKR